MRFVPTKTPEQQSGLMLHRARHLFIRQQTSVINAIRAHLAEFGITAPVGRRGVIVATQTDINRLGGNATGVTIPPRTPPILLSRRTVRGRL